MNTNIFLSVNFIFKMYKYLKKIVNFFLSFSKEIPWFNLILNKSFYIIWSVNNYRNFDYRPRNHSIPLFAYNIFTKTISKLNHFFKSILLLRAGSFVLFFLVLQNNLFLLYYFGINFRNVENCINSDFYKLSYNRTTFNINLKALTITILDYFINMLWSIDLQRN